MNSVEELMSKAELLTPEEELRLGESLVERARNRSKEAKPKRKWGDICGKAPYPLALEDAQAWVTCTRREADESRERALRGNSPM